MLQLIGLMMMKHDQLELILMCDSYIYLYRQIKCYYENKDKKFN